MSRRIFRQRIARLIPDPLLTLIRRLLFKVRGYAGARRLVRAVQSGEPLRIVVGSCGVVESGWVESDIECLNLLCISDWQRYFRPDMIAAILAEHVWEHLTPANGLLAARHCHTYLRPGGYLRIAVPDGNHPDPEYIAATRVGGTGAGADDHKVLYTQQTLEALLREAGFEVEWLEYFDTTGKFHYSDWHPADGMVHRSRRFDSRNRDGQLKYTSLIADARKRGHVAG